MVVEAVIRSCPLGVVGDRGIKKPCPDRDLDLAAAQDYRLARAQLHRSPCPAEVRQIQQLTKVGVLSPGLCHKVRSCRSFRSIATPVNGG